MPVVEAQTLFAADAPQHAPAQRQWRRAAEIRGEANGQTGGRGAAKAQMPRERGEGGAAGASAGCATPGCAARMCVRVRAAKTGHAAAHFLVLALSSTVAVIQNLAPKNSVGAICREPSQLAPYQGSTPAALAWPN